MTEIVGFARRRGPIYLVGLTLCAFIAGTQFNTSFLRNSLLTVDQSQQNQVVDSLYMEQTRRGVDPVYIKLYEEALRRSNELFPKLKLLGQKGVIIGPVEGDFGRHILRAFRNAKRIQNIIKNTNVKDVRLGIMMAEQNLKEIEEKCAKGYKLKPQDQTLWTMGCKLWEGGILFDDVLVAKDEYTSNAKADGEQGSSSYWLKALGGYIHAPYKRTMFLDSDAFPCPRFQELFDLLAITTAGRTEMWQIRSWQDVDFAAGIDQFPFGTGCMVPPGDMSILTDYEAFTERNTGTTLFNFQRQSAYTFAHFIPLVSEHIYNHVASSQIPIVNDQCPFRVAMYLFHRLHPDFKDIQIPQHSSCRTYPGNAYGGTDGFKNGMFPLQPDGTYCKECHCTPCLIAHTPTYPITINGTMGW